MWQGWSGLLSRRHVTVWRAVLFLPVLAAGVWLGNRGFKKSDPENFRRWVLRLLMLLAVLTGGKAVGANPPERLNALQRG